MAYIGKISLCDWPAFLQREFLYILKYLARVNGVSNRNILHVIFFNFATEAMSMVCPINLRQGQMTYETSQNRKAEDRMGEV